MASYEKFKWRYSTNLFLHISMSSCVSTNLSSYLKKDWNGYCLKLASDVVLFSGMGITYNVLRDSVD